MFDKWKITYQRKRIEELEHKISELQKENRYLSEKIENDKKTISEKREELLERERLISKKELQIADMYKQLKIINGSYKSVISDLINFKSDFEKMAKEEINRIRKVV